MTNVLNTEYWRQLELEQRRLYDPSTLPDKLPSSNPDLDTVIDEFERCSQQGHLLLAITLTTLVPNSTSGLEFSKTQTFRELWDKFLIQAFAAHLPKSKRHYLIASKYFLHSSPHDPNGRIHFHGVLVIPREYADRIWINGELKKAISRTLKSWRRNDKNTRPSRVPRFLVTRIANTPDEVIAPYTNWGRDAIQDVLNYAAKEREIGKIRLNTSAVRKH
jgi:hypothetical protein